MRKCTFRQSLELLNEILPKVVAALLLIIVLIVPEWTMAGEYGTISGTILNKESGEPIVGVTIMIAGTSIGTYSDLNGNYMIRKAPVGICSLKVSSVGYEVLDVVDVEVTAGETVSLNLIMTSKILDTGKKIVVTAKMLKNTEASLLKIRQKSIRVSDAISSEGMSQTGSSNAADAVKRVPGASVVGGKYVYIRGLGGRYSNAKLNGVTIPSTDPDGHAAELDLFPTHLLDNITVEKTFTPDKAGDFAGGLVDMQTKSIPEQLKLEFSSSIGYNSRTTNKEIWTAPTGKWDWLAFGGGFRSLPGILENNRPSGIANSYETAEDAILADKVNRAFTSTMQPKKRIAPFDQSYKLSFSNRYFIHERPLGILASLSYSRSFSHDSGLRKKFQSSWENDHLEYKAYDSRSKEKVLWSSYLNINYPLHPNHRLISQYIYTRSGENTCGYVAGDFTGGSTSIWQEERMILYTEQGIGNFQLNGEHLFNPFRIDWSVDFGSSTRNDPDHRYFPNEIKIDPETGDTTHSTSQPSGDDAERYYREISEKAREFKMDLSFPFYKRYGRDAALKFGWSFAKKERENMEQKFWYTFTPFQEFSGDADEIAQGEVGVDWSDTATVIKAITETTEYTREIVEWIVFGTDTVDCTPIETPESIDPCITVVVDSIVVDTIGWDSSFHLDRKGYLHTTQTNRNFTASQSVFAYYGMMEYPLLSRLNLSGGVRFEKSNFEFNDSDSGLIDELDALPSISLVYSLSDNMNLRLAYGRTIARPSFREKGGMVTIDFSRGYFIIPNPNLEQSYTRNYDLRWEWFNEPGKLLAVSLFRKIIDKPIVPSIYDQNNMSYVNLKNPGRVYGVEFEMRQSLNNIYVLNKLLGFLPGLENFTFSGNVALIKSVVDVPEGELEYKKKWGDRTTRELPGQSPYVLNLGLIYESFSTKTIAALFYNVFGKRLSHTGAGSIPDVYEHPAKLLDFTLSQHLWQGVKFKFSAQNILDSEEIHILDVPQEYVFENRHSGRKISVGFTYNL